MPHVFPAPVEQNHPPADKMKAESRKQKGEIILLLLHKLISSLSYRFIFSSLGEQEKN
jgi:hypothetical protein